MLKKVAAYFFLSFISFCFFTFIFNTVANAQTLNVPDLPTNNTPSEVPTPTIYGTAPETKITPTQPPKETSTQSPQPQFTLKTIPSPTPTPTPIFTPTPQPTIAVVTDLETLFSKYSDTYHTNKEELKKIARCESGFNSNSNFRGMYLGMFQFAASSWISARSRMGLDTNPDLRTNAEEAIKTAAYMIANGGINAWPNCK